MSNKSQPNHSDNKQSALVHSSQLEANSSLVNLNLSKLSLQSDNYNWSNSLLPPLQINSSEEINSSAQFNLSNLSSLPNYYTGEKSHNNQVRPAKEERTTSYLDKILVLVACGYLISVAAWFGVQTRLTNPTAAPQGGKIDHQTQDIGNSLSSAKSAINNQPTSSLQSLDNSRKSKPIASLALPLALQTANNSIPQSLVKALLPPPGTAKSQSLPKSHANKDHSTVQSISVPPPPSQKTTSPLVTLPPPPPPLPVINNNPSTVPTFTPSPTPKKHNRVIQPKTETITQSQFNTPINSNATLVGLMDLGMQSAALFQINGSTERTWIGENIGNTNWILESIQQEQVTIRQQNQILTISVGEKF